MEQKIDSAKHLALPILECRDVIKRFSGVLALDHINLVVRSGEIHALVGQNGAGKSTLVKTLTGVYQPDEGAILVKEKEVSFRGANEAAEYGIAIVHQDSPLVPKFDVTRNAFLGQEIVGHFGRLDLREMRRQTIESLKVIGADFGPDVLVRDLSIAEREQVAIVAALVQNPSVLILDEPTASLGAEETDHLFTVIRNLQKNGVTIIYISHHLDEVFSLASTITVLRDGQLVGTFGIHDVKRSEIIHHMVGHELSQLYPKEDIPIGEPVLVIKDLESNTAVRSVNLEVCRGEIVGLAGLVGAGRTEVALTIFGALPLTGGTIEVDGKLIKPKSPHEAKEAGIAMIPEDRREEGLITELSVRANIVLASQQKWSHAGLLSLPKERAAAQGFVERLGIVTPTLEKQTRFLSGGNQQKVVISRWLAEKAKVFIFDEPTTGVDIGAKIDIYREISQIARDGAGVLMISSDFEELVEMCDRIVVLKKGSVVKELSRGDCTVQDLLKWATGGLDEEEDNVIRTNVSLDPGKKLSELLPKMVTSTWISRVRSFNLPTRWSALLGMILAISIMGIGAPEFFKLDNIFIILKQGSLLALISLPLTVVLISGGLDMSVGAISQLTANLSSGLLIAGSSILTSFSAGIVVGLLFGLVNTFFVVVVGLFPFVTTLGAMFLAIGWAFAYNQGQALTLHTQSHFFVYGQGYIGRIPVILLLVLMITFILHFFLRRTRAGLRMYSVGESPATATLRGISKRKASVQAFMIHGVLAGLAGVLLASYSYGASALAIGLDFLISAFAAAFLGSVLSRAGELDVFGTVIGAIFITSLANGLILNGISDYVLPGIQGAILIASILVGVIRRRDIGQMLIF
jgi:ribose transport system ATP-binding protein